jgi:Fe-S-cluster-containing dehydrogenase component
MALNRRELLGRLGCAATAYIEARTADGAESTRSEGDPYAVLVDTTTCIGCRKCEWACNQASGLPLEPIETFEDKSVFETMRRPDWGHYTVVNRVDGAGFGGQPAYVKVQCMHCDEPTCDSACLVTAFTKHVDGAVTYDPSKCMGCRYCMVSCPFQVPAYEYLNPSTPQVRKCTFCHERVTGEGKVPACVEICPPQCLSFGRRSELLEVAHQRIAFGNVSYVDHVYGEHEVGGTSWLYLSRVPFTELGFPTLDTEPPTRVTEGIQHGVFKLFLPPIALFTLLGGVMRLFRADEDGTETEEGSSP